MPTPGKSYRAKLDESMWDDPRKKKAPPKKKLPNIGNVKMPDPWGPYKPPKVKLTKAMLKKGEPY